MHFRLTSYSGNILILSCQKRRKRTRIWTPQFWQHIGASGPQCFRIDIRILFDMGRTYNHAKANWQYVPLTWSRHNKRPHSWHVKYRNPCTLLCDSVRNLLLLCVMCYVYLLRLQATTIMTITWAQEKCKQTHIPSFVSAPYFTCSPLPYLTWGPFSPLWYLVLPFFFWFGSV